MITNKEIHELAERGYAQFRGPNHRIGYLVAWKRRKSDGSPLYCVFAGVESSHDVEWDSAGYFGKAFAVRLARKLVKDGYTGVYVQQVDAQTGSEREIVEFDAPAVPAVSPVPAVPAPVGVFDNLSETVPAETPEEIYASFEAQAQTAGEREALDWAKGPTIAMVQTADAQTEMAESGETPRQYMFDDVKYRLGEMLRVMAEDTRGTEEQCKAFAHVRVAEKLAERLQATASTLYGIPVVPSERARERAQRQADRNRRHYRAMRAWRKNL